MKRIILACLIGFIAAPAMAQYYTIEADSQFPGEQHVIDRVYAGNTPYLRVVFYDNKTAVALSNQWSMTFSYRPKQFDTNGLLRISGTWESNNVCLFTSATQVFANAQDYWFSVTGTNSTSGYLRTFARGKMIMEYDPSTVTSETLLTTRTLNWDEITNVGTTPWAAMLTSGGTAASLTVTNFYLFWSNSTNYVKLTANANALYWHRMTNGVENIVTNSLLP